MKIRWHRLLTSPTTHIESVEGDVVHLRVDGMVCSSVCALRTRQAFSRLDGVRRVRVDFERGIATIEGTPHDAEIYESALASVVAGKPLRRWIERAVRALAHRGAARSAM